MKAVRVNFTQEMGIWAAESPELPEWMAVADTFEEAVTLADEAMNYFLKEEVRVVPVLIGGVVWPAPSVGDTRNVGGEVVPRKIAAAV